MTTQTTPQKSSIKQRLRTDLGRSVGVTTGSIRCGSSNSKELLDHLKPPNSIIITNIKSFDFSTLYTTIPHKKLKSRLATIIRNSFLHKNGNRRYNYLVSGRKGPYLVKEDSDSKSKYTEERHNQDARVTSWQNFRRLRRKGFPTDNRHSYGHKLCPSARRHISVLILTKRNSYTPCSRPVRNG